ncbi:DUF4179 domain-containing protein [Aneurinibacillus uraniidurans]|uniref:DUF4179 domain-containing protein n=1 Tax=Aneurinibacillus uraniidurans TaxID=2966586 RepID=UPI00234B91E7|nr:DUF4179 domain-containing protein [Aneurinibacillus sp. B1]WCN36814.1 DUF4179 domain-containing protein [Aneurinibacillus sp. B1]
MNEKKMDEMLSRLGREKTEVPDFFSKGLADALNNLPELPAAIPPRKSPRWPYVAGAVAVTTLCVIGSGFVSPAMAQVLREVPLIGSVFEKTGDPVLKDMSERGLTSQPQKIATDKGVEMTITDVFYDGSRLAIGYKLKPQNNQPLKVSSDLMPLQWKIGVKETDQIQWIGDAKEVARDNGEYVGKIDLNFEIEEKSLENFTLQLDVEAIHGVAGNWKFILPISMEKTAKASTTFRPMVTKKWNGMTYTVERVTFSPATTQVIVKRTVSKEKMNDFYYIGYDEHMKRMSGGPSSGSAPKDEGNGMVTITDTLKFAAMQDIPKQITIEALIPHQLGSGSKADEKSRQSTFITVPLTEKK